MALNPSLVIIAPWRTWDFHSRTDLINFAKKHGIRVEATVEKPYSSDRNALHISFEGGVLEDPWPNRTNHVRAQRFPGKGPDRPTYVEIDLKPARPWLGRQKNVRLRVAGRPQQAGRSQRRRPGGHGRKPLRGHEVARRL
jgi:argininosuccinate synthase